jgi:integrase
LPHVLRVSLASIRRRLGASVALSRVTRMLSSAVDDRVIASSPCRRIMLPSTDDEGEVHPPTTSQVSTIVDAVDAPYRSLVILLAGSGLRIGEALGLQVSDVDFLRRTVRVERQRLQNGAIGPTKTSKSVRTVPVGDIVIAALAAHLAATGSSTDLFAAGNGQPSRYGAWKDGWTKAMRSTGLAFTAHDLRHFFASGLIAGGASVKQVQVVLGHASPVITLRVYSHLWPGDDDRVRSISDATLDGLRTSCGLEAV